MDYFVAGVGTGGTVTGVAKFFKGLGSDCKFIAVEPTKSPMMSQGKKGPHGIQGIGAGFIPGVMDMPLMDGIKTVTEEEAINTARKMALEEGIFGGISSGANVCEALKLARDPKNRGKLIVTVICDTGERYLSSPLFEKVTNECKAMTITQ